MVQRHKRTCSLWVCESQQSCDMETGYGKRTVIIVAGVKFRQFHRFNYNLLGSYPLRIAARLTL